VTGIDTRCGFSRNGFYYPFLLSQVPSGCSQAPDAGRGTGLPVRRLPLHGSRRHRPCTEVISEVRIVRGHPQTSATAKPKKLADFRDQADDALHRQIYAAAGT
jgi:hypothetical protein